MRSSSPDRPADSADAHPPPPRPPRAAALMLAMIAAAVGFFVHLEFVRMAGFPDGHITDLARARVWLGSAYALVCATVSVLSFAAGLGVARTPHPRRLASLLAAATLLALLLDRLLAARLDDGGGG